MKLRKSYTADKWLLIDDDTLEIQQINIKKVFVQILEGKTVGRWFISKSGDIYDIWKSNYITDFAIPSFIRNILGLLNIEIIHYFFITDNVLKIVEH